MYLVVMYCEFNVIDNITKSTSFIIKYAYRIDFQYCDDYYRNPSVIHLYLLYE